MDTSKEFIKMLGKAIQSEPSAFRTFDRTKNVQDQLQEMVIKDVLPYDIFHNMSRWVDDPWGYGDQPFRRHWGKLKKWDEYMESLTSMEQLWLAFVMKTKYNKTWDGDNWIEQK